MANPTPKDILAMLKNVNKEELMQNVNKISSMLSKEDKEKLMNTFNKKEE